jgi:hypothetical protein
MQYKQCKKPFVLVIMPEIIGDPNAIEVLIASGYIFLKSLNFSAMQAFYRIARQAPGIGGCTGDQSLSDTLSASLIPVYHKIEATKADLAEYLAKKCLEGLSRPRKKILSKTLFDIGDPAQGSDTATIFSDSVVSKINDNIKSLRNQKDLTRNFVITPQLVQHINQASV